MAERINKMWCICTVECYLAFKKQWNSDMCYNMDEPLRHYAKGNKPNTKGKYCMIQLKWGTLE